MAGTETRNTLPSLPGFWEHVPRSSSNPHTALVAYMLLQNSSHTGLWLRRLDTLSCHGGNGSVVETCTLGNINPSVAVSLLSHSFSAKTANNLPHFSAGDRGSFRLERERETERYIDREQEREGIQAECSCLDMTDCWNLTSWLSVSLARKPKA